LNSNEATFVLELLAVAAFAVALATPPRVHATTSMTCSANDCSDNYCDD